MSANSQKLLELIEKDKLIRLIEIFTRATDITIDVNDDVGYPVVQHQFFYGFCKMIRSTEEGLKRCIESNAEVGFKTSVTGKVCFSTCHAGAVLMAVPIVIDGSFCGSITCGQLHLSPPDEEKLSAMWHSTRDLGLDRYELERTYKEIQVISMEKCLAASELIQFMISYMMELVYRAEVKEQAAREKLRNMREAKTRAELENSLRMAELKNMQAQIKPHFLFNTLNTIRGLITLGKNEKALETLYAFSGLLRYALEQHGELVSLREELLYINRYLMIQKLRFGERLAFTVEVEESLQEIPIPFLTLQPIVENACIHGLEPKENCGRLQILGAVSGNVAAISVTDDGVGIPDDVLTDLRSRLSMASADNSGASKGMGLWNVHRRLQLYFGANFGLHLESGQGYTRVTLKLPVVTM
ncbi:MAG: PocR ligand-binding domain-containing protein [Peptococcaceae bacterium]|nr:PocR ligand-binding domain-containing protein [Peptococcaceae bacterium]